MIPRPHSLDEVLMKAEKFGFHGEEQDALVAEYDRASREYSKTVPTPTSYNFEATCAWIDGKHETAYRATIKKLYELIDGEQKRGRG